MKKHLAPIAIVIVELGCMSAISVHADEAPALPPPSQQTWKMDQALLETTEAAVQSGGILAVESRVTALEQALSGAQLTQVSDGTTYMLTDGTAETLIALAMASSDKSHNTGQVVAVANPYPAISLYLGSYYNEVGKPDDALRVLDAGLSLSVVSGIELGEHRPFLISERGAALIALKRWSDALADYENGLKNDSLDDGNRARMDRGRGFALTELGRLEEAEQAYRDSLKLEPGNPRAQSELEYIAQLRAGGAHEPASLSPVQPQSETGGATSH